MPKEKAPRLIRIAAGSVSMLAELNDTETADSIWQALPIVGQTRVWGDEIYFPIPVKHKENNAQSNVPSGTLAYWPPGHSFCIFWGQKPASPVNVVGQLKGEPHDWAKAGDGIEIRIEAAS